MTIVAQWEITGNEKISNKWLLSARNRELISAEHIFGNEVCQAFCTRINLSVKARKLLQFNMEIMKIMFHSIQALVRWKYVVMFSCYLARNGEGVCHNSWFPTLRTSLLSSYSYSTSLLFMYFLPMKSRSSTVVVCSPISKPGSREVLLNPAG